MPSLSTLNTFELLIQVAWLPLTLPQMNTTHGPPLYKDQYLTLLYVDVHGEWLRP